MLHQNDILQFLERVNADKVLHCHPNQLLPQLQAIRDHNPNQIFIEEIGHSRDGCILYALVIGDTKKILSSLLLEIAMLKKPLVQLQF